MKSALNSKFRGAQGDGQKVHKRQDDGDGKEYEQKPVDIWEGAEAPVGILFGEGQSSNHNKPSFTYQMPYSPMLLLILLVMMTRVKPMRFLNSPTAVARLYFI